MSARALGGISAALLSLVASHRERAEAKLLSYAAITLDQGFDSNVNYSRGPDAVTRLVPRIGLLHRKGGFHLSTHLRLALHHYLGDKAETTLNHRTDIRLLWSLSRRLLLDGTAVLVDAEDPGLLDRPGVQIPQGGLWDLDLTVKSQVLASRRLKLHLQPVYRLSRLDAGPGTDEYQVSVGAAYRFSRRLEVFSAGRWQHFVSTGQTSALHPSAGLTWQATRRVRLSVHGGPFWFYEGRNMAFLFAGGIAWLGPSRRISLFAERDLTGGTGSDHPIWIQSLRLGISLWPYRQTTLHTSAGLYQSGPAPRARADVTGLLGQMGASVFLLERRIRLDLYAQHRAQGKGDSLRAPEERTQAGLRITVTTSAISLDKGFLP